MVAENKNEKIIHQFYDLVRISGRRVKVGRLAGSLIFKLLKSAQLLNYKNNHCQFANCIKH